MLAVDDSLMSDLNAEDEFATIRTLSESTSSDVRSFTNHFSEKVFSMVRKSNGPTSTEDILAWRRQKKREVELISKQSANRGRDLNSIHGMVAIEGVKTSSTRLDINDYGRGAGSIADIGVIKPRKR